MWNLSAISLILFGMLIAGNMFVTHVLFKWTHSQKLTSIRAWVTCMLLVCANIIIGFIVNYLQRTTP